ncbi:hypothetical protein BX616_007874, partial [Lobosporangium transversale]
MTVSRQEPMLTLSFEVPAGAVAHPSNRSANKTIYTPSSSHTAATTAATRPYSEFSYPAQSDTTILDSMIRTTQKDQSLQHPLQNSTFNSSVASFMTSSTADYTLVTLNNSSSSRSIYRNSLPIHTSISIINGNNSSGNHINRNHSTSQIHHQKKELQKQALRQQQLQQQNQKKTLPLFPTIRTRGTISNQNIIQP